MSTLAPPPVETALFGLLAEFETSGQLLNAVRAARAAGLTRLDAYSPIPVEGLAEALGRKRSRIPAITLLAGLTGAATGYGMQYYSAVFDYPLNVGGRPLHSWPAFFPITFELTILFAALATVIGMLAINGLPLYYHPLFNVPEFLRASRDRFFLVILATDPDFDPDRAHAFLAELRPLSLSEVPR